MSQPPSFEHEMPCYTSLASDFPAAPEGANDAEQSVEATRERVSGIQETGAEAPIQQVVHNPFGGPVTIEVTPPPVRRPLGVRRTG